MTRDQVLQKCYCAKSLREVEEAFLARSHWLHEHPDDGEIFHVGVMLSRLKDAYEMEAAEAAACAEVAAVT